MGRLRAPLRLIAGSVRARAKFNIACQKKAEFSSSALLVLDTMLRNVRDEVFALASEA